MKHRFLSVLLCCIIWVVLFPAMSLAADTEKGFVVPIDHSDIVPSDYIGIYTVEEFLAVDWSLGKKYILMSDLDMNGIVWTPQKCVGTLNGNGYTIRNLSICAEFSEGKGKMLYGLFSSLRGTVKNLSLTDINIEVSCIIEEKTDAEICIGGITGEIDTFGSEINNCYVTGKIDVATDITLDFYADVNIGGIIGHITDNPSSCFNSANYATISITDTGTMDYVSVGGIVGFQDDSTSSSEATFSNLSNYGTITGASENNRMRIGGIAGTSETAVFSDCKNIATLSLDSKYGYADVGGIVGYASGLAETRVIKCYNTGNLHGISKYKAGVGGILGDSHYQQDVDIENCYNTGDLSLDNIYKGLSGYAPKDNGVGGIVGSCQHEGSIISSYHYGNIVFTETSEYTETYVGGIIGYTKYGNVVQDCYWSNDVEIIGKSRNESTVSGGGILNTVNASNKVTYTGFDFETVWQMGRDGLPVLRDSSISDISPLEYFVTFDANGGKGDMPNDTIYKAGTEVLIPFVHPIKDGCTFAGWSDGTNVYQPGDTFFMPESEVVLVATWKINTTDSQQNVEIDMDNYYTITEQRLFRIQAAEVVYPMPAGFKIIANGETFQNDKETCFSTDDIDVYLPTDYDGEIEITKEGYHRLLIPAEMTGQYNHLTMMSETNTEPFVQALLMDYSKGSYISYRNLLVETGGVFELDISGRTEPQISSLYPMINWNGHGEGEIWLEQDAKTVSLTNQAKNEVCLPQYFLAENPIFLCTKAADGTLLRQKTNLRIFKRTETTLNLDLGNAFVVNTAESKKGDISILSNEELTFDFSEWSNDVIPIEFTIKADNTVEGILGLTLYKTANREAVFGRMKDSLDRLATETGVSPTKEHATLFKEMSQYGVPIENGNTFGVSGSAEVLGYFTGSMVDGSCKILDMKIALAFDGKLTYTYNTVITVGSTAVPAYFQSSLKSEIETLLEMIYDEDSGKMVSIGTQPLESSLGISTEIGPGWKEYVSGGVKGSGAIKVNSEIPMSVETTTLCLGANFSLVGSIGGVEGEWVFYKTPEMIFWDAGEWCWEKAEGNSLQAAAFVPNLDLKLMSISDAENVVVNGVSGYTAPCIAELTDGRLLAVWKADVSGRSAVDKGGIWYSIYENKDWSEPMLVDDDETNDSVPQLYIENGVVQLAWQNYMTVFDSDTLPEYDVISAQNSVMTAIFYEETDTWDELTEDTPEWYLADTDLPNDFEEDWVISSSSRKIISYNGTRAILYTTADQNGVEQVWGFFNDGYGWGQPVQLTSIPDGVNGFDALMDVDGLTILYTCGEYANASLAYCKVGWDIDLLVSDVDYIRETLVPGHTLTLASVVKNNSLSTINGVHISVLDGYGRSVHEEDIDVRFTSGEEDVLYINYTLPEDLHDLDSLMVVVLPLDGADADESNNITDCFLNKTDLSIENVSAIYKDGITQIVTQVVNRGQTKTAETDLLYYLETSGGEAYITDFVSELEPGQIENIIVSVDGIDSGEIIHVKIPEQTNENIIANNSSHTIVQMQNSDVFAVTADAIIEENSVVLDIDVINSTMENALNLNLIAAVYDTTTGKQIDCVVFDAFSINGLTTYTKTATLYVGSRKNSIEWKVFISNSNGSPIIENISGIIK